MNALLKSFSGLGLGLQITVGASAGIIPNGDFETGDLTGWMSVGGVNGAITQDSFTSTPALDGIYSGQVKGGSGLLPPADLDSFFGLTLGTIFGAPLTDPQDEVAGAGIKQSLMVQPGDVISFLWNAPFLESGLNDAAFFATTDNGGTVVKLADGDNGPLGVTSMASYTFETGGMQTIGFGFVNGGDSCCTAESIMVDNVSISSGRTPVPAPATLALLGLGLLGFRLRRMA